MNFGALPLEEDEEETECADEEAFDCNCDETDDDDAEAQDSLVYLSDEVTDLYNL